MSKVGVAYSASAEFVQNSRNTAYVLASLYDFVRCLCQMVDPGYTMQAEPYVESSSKNLLAGANRNGSPQSDCVGASHGREDWQS